MLGKLLQHLNQLPYSAWMKQALRLINDDYLRMNGGKDDVQYRSHLPYPRATLVKRECQIFTLTCWIVRPCSYFQLRRPDRVHRYLLHLWQYLVQQLIQVQESLDVVLEYIEHFWQILCIAGKHSARARCRVANVKPFCKKPIDSWADYFY